MSLKIIYQMIRVIRSSCMWRFYFLSFSYRIYFFVKIIPCTIQRNRILVSRIFNCRIWWHNTIRVHSSRRRLVQIILLRLRRFYLNNWTVNIIIFTNCLWTCYLKCRSNILKFSSWIRSIINFGYILNSIYCRVSLVLCRILSVIRSIPFTQWRTLNSWSAIMCTTVGSILLAVVSTSPWLTLIHFFEFFITCWD